MYQKLTIVGNLGSDPEMRYMPDGTAVTSFSVATNRRWNDSQSGQPVNETTWFRVSVWGRRAETANQYLSKGSRVLVEGRLSPDKGTGGPRIWTRQDGTAAASYEVRALDFQFMSARGENTGDMSGYGSPPSSGGGGGRAVQEEDDIPF